MDVCSLVNQLSAGQLISQLPCWMAVKSGEDVIHQNRCASFNSDSFPTILLRAFHGFCMGD